MRQRARPLAREAIDVLSHITLRRIDRRNRASLSSHIVPRDVLIDRNYRSIEIDQNADSEAGEGEGQTDYENFASFNGALPSALFLSVFTFHSDEYRER